MTTNKTDDTTASAPDEGTEEYLYEYSVLNLVRTAAGDFGMVVAVRDVDPASEDEDGTQEVTVALFGGGTANVHPDQLTPVEG